MKRFISYFVLGFIVGNSLIAVFHYLHSINQSFDARKKSLKLVTQSQLLSHNRFKIKPLSPPRPATTSPKPGPGCPDRPLHIVIIVHSAPSGFEQRRYIRNSWMLDYTGHVTVKFSIGLFELDSVLLGKLAKEQETHGDLLFLDELKDAYSNLTTKLFLGVKWVNQNLDFDYLVKTDDDTYVMADAMSNALRKMNCTDRLYWGFFIGNGRIHSEGRWAEHNWFKCPTYLPYAYGGGYLLSRRVVRSMMQFPHRLILYRNSDVSMGSWSAPFAMKRKHDLNYNVRIKRYWCSNKDLIVHKERAKEKLFNDVHQIT